MGFSSELTVILAAVGAVIFLFTMDHYYRSTEARNEEKRVEGEPTLAQTAELDALEPAISETQESTDENHAAA